MSASFAVVAPHASAARDLAGLPDDVRVEVWDGAGAFPGGDDIEIWMPPFTPVDIAGIARSLPRLRVVQLATSGADHLPPDLPESVAVHTARGVHDAPVAEWVLTAVLAMQRSLPASVRDQAAGTPMRHLSGRLGGSRVLLLGHGSVGKAVERLLTPFDVRLTRVAHSARDGVHAASDLHALLPETDIVVVLVPLDDSTRGLIGALELAALPDRSLVVNASRGEVIDQDALFRELETGRLRAALDVSVPDPLPAHHPALNHPGLLYTPHVAGVVDDAFARVHALLVDQILRHRAGEPLRNPWPRS